MKKLIVSLLGIALMCSVAAAGPLKTEAVQGDAKWVAHLDVESLVKSGLGQFILSVAAEKEGFTEGLAKFQETAGFDPLKDLRGVTIYGPAVGKEQGVVVIDATVNADKLLGLLKDNPTYQAIDYGDRVLHKWTDLPKSGPDGVAKAGKTQAGCFYDDKTIVIASTVEMLQAAIDVLDGKKDNLAKTGSLTVLPKPAAGSFLVAAAADIPAPPAEAPAGTGKGENAVLRRISDASLQVGEADGALFAALSVTARTAEDALNLRQMAQGFAAMLKIMMQEKLPEDMQNLGEKIEIGGTDTVARLDVSIPTESLISLAKYLEQHRKAMKAQESTPPRD